MKNVVIVLSICILLCGMPLGLSDCGCNLPDDASASAPQSMAPLLTDANITALQQQGIQEGWTFTVAKNPATEQSLSQLCGLVVPENWWADASFDPCLPLTTLPSRFDWRELVGCTPIRNQGGCGSCWAFGTVAPLECNILIRDHKEVDLSEQWLVSCNTNGWGCNGGWFAHDFHQWKMDRFNGTGAVLEQDFPYTATNAPCAGPYEHPYRLDSWHFIGFSQGVPKTDAIKQAIMSYGPVSVSCAVTDAFAAYSGGVFNADDPHAPSTMRWHSSAGTTVKERTACGFYVIPGDPLGGKTDICGLSTASARSAMAPAMWSIQHGPCLRFPAGRSGLTLASEMSGTEPRRRFNGISR